jgi:hypothetical protein
MNMGPALKSSQSSAAPGVWPQVVTQIPVRYDVPNYAGNYTGVLVRLPDGSGIPLELEEVQ